MNEQTEIKQELLTRRLLRIAERLDRIEQSLVKLQLLNKHTQLILNNIMVDKNLINKDVKQLSDHLIDNANK
ncbi:hypothetical protein [Psittacicella hinzii]|uniref:Uncharacterized protein n=1 Tax=Psittacicella hinzii TaxID=2028575 RepID=A0A3A1YGE5_9GAMM|nr:hypothetical protein [Psittacicella hinzii]RIY35284.1 hypothetical protein CKF58_06820 [Psittacicella hinzii]